MKEITDIQSLTVVKSNNDYTVELKSKGIICHYSLKSAFDIVELNSILKSLNLIDERQIYFVSYDQYELLIKYCSNLLVINKIINEKGMDAKASDIRSIMLDGFKHRNLVTEAEKEHNLEKFVLLAYDKFLSLDGRMAQFYE